MALPLFVNRFFEPTEMNSEAFFSRWKQLSQPSQESQKIFAATQGMDNEPIKAKVGVVVVVAGVVFLLLSSREGGQKCCCEVKLLAKNSDQVW